MAQQKRNIFSFGDEEDEDDILINSVKPLPSNAVERSAFTAAEFDADTFLSSRRHLGLERMKAELNTHLKSLKTELVELINRDYQDFINLSINLKGVDREIEDLKTPLANMEVEVNGVRDHFQGVIDTLENQLKSRAELRNKKSTLKLLMNIHDSISKVENLLDINTDIIKPVGNINIPANNSSIINDDSPGKQIERVAIEYNQMYHLVRRGKHLAFVSENEWRITRIKDTIEHKLYKTLSTALSQIRLGEVTRATKQSLTQCLRTYALIDNTQIAEKIIREEFVRPVLAKIITQKAVEGARNYGSPSGSDESKHPLSIMYTKILAFASTDLQPILDITQKTLKGSSYEILVNSLWLETTEMINKACKSIFAAGQTDIFHKNYTATVSFISGLEGLCYSKRSLLYLRNHPSYTDFMKRWQLLVYFQLRFREIVKDVEDVLGDKKESLSMKVASSNEELILQGSKVVYSAIGQCWNDQIFLYGLSHRFWKLTLQLIVRYNVWASEVVSDTTETSKTSNEEYLKSVCILHHDINSMVSLVKRQGKEVIFPQLPMNVQELPVLKESLDGVLDQLIESTVPKIVSCITNRISTECRETLNLVKSITSHYRHTNKQMPTKPSYFIPNVFKPLHQFTKQNEKWADANIKQEWAQVVSKTIIMEYTSIVNDLLSSMKKTEEPLNKKSANSKDNMTDEEKIRLQLYLDVEQLGQELDQLKIDRTNLDYYNTLYDIVKPFSYDS